MEPRIQYAKTSDGVSIAYWTLGDGPPLVHVPVIPMSHIQLEWQVPEVRNWYQGLAAQRTLIRYDSRGSGLSDRDVTDHTLEAQILDLEAVVERLGLETFDLLASLHGGLVAIKYAASHLERVSHLVLWHCFARPSALFGPETEAVLELAKRDWNTYVEVAAQRYHGYWSEGEVAHRIAGLFRESTGPETHQAVTSEFRGLDVTSLLSEVTSPTLVLHRREEPILNVDEARRLASQIPDARLALLEGVSWGPWIGDVDGVLRTINEFLSEGEEAGTGVAPSGLVTILFTDVEGSTALTQRLGDARARDLLRQHERMVREALKAHGGSELKTMGDGFMASFSSATKALECSIAIQRAFAAHNESAEEPILVRVGLNAGEPIAEDEDLFGTAVIEAARIAAAAKGGEILVSNVVRELAKGKQFLFSDRGEVDLKGFDEPVRLYEVRWRN